RPVIPVTDAPDGALESEGVEGPRHGELARFLRQASPLCLGSQSTEQLEIGSVECLRSDEPRDAHTRPTLDDREQVVGMLLIRQWQRADKLPHVFLLLQGAEQLIVGLAQRSKLHGLNVREQWRPAQVKRWLGRPRLEAMLLRRERSSSMLYARPPPWRVTFAATGEEARTPQPTRPLPRRTRYAWRRTEAVDTHGLVMRGRHRIQASDHVV